MIPFGMNMQTPDGEQTKTVLHEFEGYVECPLFSEECKICIEKEGISITGMFQQLSIHYGEISALEWRDYQVALQTVAGEIRFSRMGQEAQWFYEKLYSAYNEAVLKALLVSGKLLLEAAGEYTAEEGDVFHQGEAFIRVYEDCLCILPPNDNARRLPFNFITKAHQTDYAYEITMASGERYTLSQMGYGLDDLDRNIRSLFYQLREKTSAWHKELAPDMSSLQAASATGLMLLGRAADFRKLKTAVPPLVAALEEKLGKSRIAGTWPWLQELCGGEGLMLGAMPAPEKGEGEISMEALLGNGNPLELLGAAKTSKQPASDTADAMGEVLEEPLPILWVIVPDPSSGLAAVELALADNEAAATYLYRFQEDWQTFAGKVDRALEACAFRREAILLPEEKLSLPQHLPDAMLIRRTPALSALRNAFAGRAIHTSMERWKTDIEKCQGTVKKTVNIPDPGNKCATCGALLSADAKFCGQCGTRI